MAERSNATSKKNQEAAQDVSTLRKRGRRRLVGAIALVLLAVIILPMVFDPEPKQTTPPVNIRIPSEEGTPFTPKAAQKGAPPSAAVQAPSPSASQPGASQPVPQQATPQAEPRKQDKGPPPPYAKVEVPTQAAAPAPIPEPPARVEEKPVARTPEAKPAEKPAAKPAEKKAAPAPAAPALAPGEKLIVQVGAFGSPEKVKEITDQLKEARLVHYTESIATAKGSVTRVRLGPFSSREAADKARDRAKALGLNPANPALAAPPAGKPGAK